MTTIDKAEDGELNLTETLGKYRYKFVPMGDPELVEVIFKDHPVLDFIEAYVNTKAEQLAIDRAKTVDRLEVIDETGRAYVKGSIYGSPVKVELSYQDDNKTLKIFVESTLNKDNKENL